MSLSAKLIRIFFPLLFIIVPLIFLPNTSELFEFNKMVVTYLLTIFIVTAWIARMLSERRLIFRRTLLDWPLLIFLVIQLTSLFFSIDPRTSLMGYYSRFNGGLLSLVSYALLYWAAVSNLDQKSVRTTLFWGLVSAVAVALWGFAEHFGVDASWWVQDVQVRVFSTLGQPNWLAAYLVALIFIPLGRALFAKRLSWFQICLSLLFFIVLLYTKSRSAYLAFGLSSVIFWGYFLATARPRPVKPLAVFAALTLIFTFLVSNPVRDLVFSHLKLSPTPAPAAAPAGSTALETGGTESGIIREIVWTGAIHIWDSSVKNFLLGSGPETFAMSYYQFRPLAHNNTSEWELLYNKAHNEFLNYLSTTGLLGLLSYLLLLAGMLVIFIRALKSPSGSSPKNSHLELALLAGWVSISVTNFWGFSVVIMQIFLFLFPAFALLSAFDHPLPPPTASPRPWLIFIPLLPALLICYFLFDYWLADTYYASGIKSFQAFNQTQSPQYVLDSYQQLSQAYQLNPLDPPISSELSLSAAFMALLTHSTDATASAQLAQVADVASQKAIDQSPFHPNYYKNRARTLIVLGSMDPAYYVKSDAVLARAQVISPTDPRIPYIRAINAKYEGNTAAEKKFLEAALSLKPDFADALGQLQLLASPSGKMAP